MILDFDKVNEGDIFVNRGKSIFYSIIDKTDDIIYLIVNGEKNNFVFHTTRDSFDSKGWNKFIKYKKKYKDFLKDERFIIKTVFKD